MADTTPTTSAPRSIRELVQGGTPLAHLGKATSGGLKEIALTDLQPNPWQYRSDDPGWAEELAVSIDAKGLLEAVTYRTNSSGAKELIAGHTRVAAYRLLASEDGDRVVGRARTPEERARFASILANEKLNVTDDDMRVFVVIDNLHRKDPNVIDTAHAIATYREEKGLTIAQVAGVFAHDQRRVDRLLKLDAAPTIIKDAAAKGIMVTLRDDDGQPLTTPQGREKREHRTLDLMAAVELAALYAHATRKAPKRADKLVTHLVNRTLEDGWPFRKVMDAIKAARAKLDGATAPGGSDEAPEGHAAQPADETPNTDVRALYRSNGKAVTVFLSRIDGASPEARAELRSFLQKLAGEVPE